MNKPKTVGSDKVLITERDKVLLGLLGCVIFIAVMAFFITSITAAVSELAPAPIESAETTTDDA